jgi:GT2 family glycosyltransferase
MVGALRRLRELGRRARRLRFSGPRARRRAALQELQALPERPLISLVMPTYRSNLKYLREAIDSVRGQLYPDWELCIADDGSGRPELESALAAYARTDQRIRFRAVPENRGISAATNEAMSMCRGEFVGFIDHDDTLTPDALLRFAQVLTADPEIDVVYSDQDKLTLHGIRADPFLKPDWSPVYALGAMYIGHLLVVRRSVAEAAGGFDSAFDTIQDFEFMMRVSEQTDRIHHIPQILYHWRAIPGSIAAGTDQKSGVEELQARAVSEHLARIGVEARAVPHERIPHRAVLAPLNGNATAPRGRVSVVIDATRNRSGVRRTVESILRRTSHPDYEVILAGADQSLDTEDARVRVVPDEGARLGRARAHNVGAAAAEGVFLLFAGPDLEPVDADWLELLVLHAAVPGVAAVGPMIARPGGRVAQAGVAIGLKEPAMPMLAGLSADGDGYYGALPCSREVSALSGECMLVRRADFEEAGGFNEMYSREYEDFDLCRRLARRGRKAVYAARPTVVTHRTEADIRASIDIVDRALFVDCWYDELKAGDPFFNPGFASQRADYVPAGWREKVYRAAAPLGIR